MDKLSGLSSTAATFECWMKMPAAAGVAGQTQTLSCQGLGAPEFMYAGDDKLKVIWLGHECDSADTAGVRRHVAPRRGGVRSR